MLRRKRITWFAEHRVALPEMRNHARRKAAQYTWGRYAQSILNVLLCRTGFKAHAPLPRVA